MNYAEEALREYQVTDTNTGNMQAFDSEAEALEYFETDSFTDDVIERFNDDSVLISWHQ